MQQNAPWKGAQGKCQFVWHKTGPWRWPTQAGGHPKNRAGHQEHKATRTLREQHATTHIDAKLLPASRSNALEGGSEVPDMQ
eukprot:3639400-Pyramimonas_sp.AAC.1